ncbi:hypothetical protein AAFF_G00366190 [Aldrovandia affinis]|uniref:Uncharacterized protein n=1 Tax=Aldrovandia affinis TaxID=143900 RepID=A0AAD7WMI2_9TELE|nr:hypothetical protein AAFF_G00366190 [Aldrovandia affinis]
MDGLKKRDLAQTSTGIGHIYRLPLPCNIDSQRGAPLPPLLCHTRLITPSRHFSSSVSMEHDRKPLTGPLTQPLYPKASPHWAVNFVDELGDKLRDCHATRMLSQPVSEMQDRYRGLSAPQRQVARHYSMPLALYRQFETDKIPFLNEPYISTAHTDYRRFSRSELFPPGCLYDGDYSKMPAPKAPPRPSCQPFLHRPLLHVPYGACQTVGE